jgi:oligopeptide/dipeptide ABC transporter ATP-binding protein
MYAGRVMETAPVADLFRRPMHPYTRGLLGSIPRPREDAGAARRKRLPTIEGVVPDLRRLSPGCRFAERCPMRVERCVVEEPWLLEVAPDRASRCWRAEEVAP